MAKKIVKISDIDREQWLKERRKGIGGSDAATIIGLNPYGSLYELWADKQGFLPPKEDTEQMRVGRDLEPYVAKRFCEATGKKVQRLPYMYCHDKYPFITANIDRKIVGENAALECKTTSLFNKSDFEDGEVQPSYLCQCYHYMNVMGYDKMYLAVLILSKGFFWYEIDKNEEQQAALLKAEVDFWNEYILGDSVPAPDGSESAGRALQEVFREEKGETVALMHADRLFEGLARIKDSISALEKNKTECEQKIKMCLGEASEGIGTDYKCSWRTQSRESLDSKAIKSEYPEIYDKFKKVTKFRAFKIFKINK